MLDGRVLFRVCFDAFRAGRRTILHRIADTVAGISEAFAGMGHSPAPESFRPVPVYAENGTPALAGRRAGASAPFYFEKAGHCAPGQAFARSDRPIH